MEELLRAANQIAANELAIMNAPTVENTQEQSNVSHDATLAHLPVNIDLLEDDIDLSIFDGIELNTPPPSEFSE